MSQHLPSGRGRHTSPPPIRILGLDPGSRHTGYGLIEKRGARLIFADAGVISPPAGCSLSDRLDTIYAALAERLESFAPDEVAVEDIFHAVNVRTALLLAHVRGVLLLAVARAGLPVAAYPPATVKKCVVGTGSASKAQVEWMMDRLLEGAPARLQQDAADALAVAVCHAAHRGSLTGSAGRTSRALV